MKKIIMKCENCGKEVEVPENREKTFRFCSRSCFGKKVLSKNQAKIKRNYGEDHPKWKGGCVRKDGYKLISVKGKQYFEHRYIMEKYLGKKLKTKEQIHHKNGNKTDNRICNLEVISIGEHTKKTVFETRLIQRIGLTCDNCGKFFLKKRYRINDGLNFCSKKCRDEAIKSGLIGFNCKKAKRPQS